MCLKALPILPLGFRNELREGNLSHCANPLGTSPSSTPSVSVSSALPCRICLCGLDLRRMALCTLTPVLTLVGRICGFYVLCVWWPVIFAGALLWCISPPLTYSPATYPCLLASLPLLSLEVSGVWLTPYCHPCRLSDLTWLALTVHPSLHSAIYSQSVAARPARRCGAKTLGGQRFARRSPLLAVRVPLVSYVGE